MKTEVYAEDHTILVATINVADNKEYCEVLTKLFNNKRDEKSIIELVNYYENNRITVAVDLDEYGSEAEDKGEKHILDWMQSLGNDIELVSNRVENARIYTYMSIYEPSCTLPTYDRVEMY